MSQALDAAMTLSGSEASGVYLLSASGIEVRSRGVTECEIDRYLSFGPAGQDPMLNYLVTNHLAVHDRLLYDEKEWQRLPLYDIAIAPSGLHRYMLAPIIVSGDVIGALTCGRRNRRAYDTTDLLGVNTLAFFVSHQAMLCMSEPLLEKLSSRQRDVAILVAKGMRNREIANFLAISVDYVKQLLKESFQRLEVTTRSELAAVVSQHVAS
jgi:DNA-binding CsgD family transcriptional regulator